MSTSTRNAWLAAILSVAALGGCASSSNKVTVQDSTKISKGQELSDLQRALQERAVTPDEYETLRRTIMRRPQ